jgi:hypothetical protein
VKNNYYTDYYAGGMALPGRSFNQNAYRYGMNGQEKDDEIFNGAYTAEYWEYDSRIIRRWNTDPVVKPWESSYACFRNNPIYYSDPSGLDGEKPKGKGKPVDQGDNKSPTIKNPGAPKQEEQKPAEAPTPIQPNLYKGPIATPQDNTLVVPHPTGTNDGPLPPSGSTVDLSDGRRNTDLYNTFGVSRNNPLFYNLSPTYSQEKRWMKLINWNQGSAEVSAGIFSLNNNGDFSVTLGVAKIDQNFNITPTLGKASVNKNSWDIFIASWGRSEYRYYEPILGRTNAYMVYKIVYINTTGAIMSGNRRVIVSAGEQLFSSVPVLDFNIKLLDSSWQFIRAPLNFGELGIDASSD